MATQPLYTHQQIQTMIQEHINRINTALSVETFSGFREEHMKGRRQAYEQVKSWVGAMKGPVF
ncbi:MAG: hypothetical protein V3R38_00660 [bacterium]